MSVKPEYHILRFDFETPVRFGNEKGAAGLSQTNMTAASDTVFSALCIEWINLFGEHSLPELIEQTRNGSFGLSSFFPWAMKTGSDEINYYLPRPLLRGQSTSKSGTNVKKQLKGLPWIAIEQLDGYLSFVKSGEGELDQFKETFGMEVIWDRVNTRTGTDPEPYQVSAWQFNKSSSTNKRRLNYKPASGLYLVILSSQPQFLSRLLTAFKSLGLSGVGGKTSSGLGKFTLQCQPIGDHSSHKSLLRLLQDETAPVQMLLSTVSPNDDDMDILEHPDSSYLLFERSGFTASNQFCDQETGRALKRKSCILIKEGSCFPKRLIGSVIDLSYAGLHPVYRQGKAMSVGLKL